MGKHTGLIRNINRLAFRQFANSRLGLPTNIDIDNMELVSVSEGYRTINWCLDGIKCGDSNCPTCTQNTMKVLLADLKLYRPKLRKGWH